jgi:K+-sensing histidine kinase KdpD
VVTAVLNPATFSFVYVAAALYFVASDPRGPVALTIVLAVAVLLGSVAAPARLRSIGFDERHAEADLAATMARLLPRTDDLRCAMLAGSGRLGRALTLPAAPIELDAVAGEEQRAAFALRDGGTLLVPADLPQTTERQARERVVGSVEALCVWRAIARGERP